MPIRTAGVACLLLLGFSRRPVALEDPLGPTPLARAAALTESAVRAVGSEERRRLVNEALREDMRHVPALNLRGLLDLEEKEWRDARNRFEEVLKERPFAFEAHKNCGYAHLLEMVEWNRLEDKDQAVAAEGAFQASQKEAPQEPASYWNLGILLYLMGREPEALVEFDRAVSRGPTLRHPARGRESRFLLESAAAPRGGEDPRWLREQLAIRNEGGGDGALSSCPRRVLVAHLAHTLSWKNH